jgi:hypothetical protein
MYNRDGSPRPSWFDPLGFAELDQVPPPSREVASITARFAAIEARNAELEELIGEATEELQRLGTALRGMTGGAHLEAQHERQQARVAEQAAIMRGLLQERAENQALLDALARRIERARVGRADGPHDHIRHPMEPVAVETMRFRRATEFWAAVSVSGLIIALVAFILFAPGHLLPAAIVVVIAFVLGESVMRGTFIRTVNRIAVILALISSVVLIVQFWRVGLIAVLLGVAAFLILQRVREFRA